jgi:hypothetical protein
VRPLFSYINVKTDGDTDYRIVSLCVLVLSPHPVCILLLLCYEILTAQNRDGKSNYMEGIMLITLYFVIALACKPPIFILPADSLIWV